VSRTIPLPAPSVVVTFVHGTWATGTTWPTLSAMVRAKFGEVQIRHCCWSGRNSLKQRKAGAARLATKCRRLRERHPAARHVVIAHSHGGAVLYHALEDETVRGGISGAVFLSTPFVYFTYLESSLLAMSILGGSLGIYGLAAFLFVRTLLPEISILGLSNGVSQLLLSIGLYFVAFWGVLGVIAWADMAGRQFAEDHASKPLIGLPTLVVRSPSDEASLALTACQALATTTRVLAARGERVVFNWRRAAARNGASA